MRTASLLALSLLALPLPAPTSYAMGEPATCLGRTATIVGGDGLVTGTEGPDVIVASGISTVEALGGDDVVCLEVGSVVLSASGEGPVAKVNAGAGDDVVNPEDLEAFWAPNGGESFAWEAIVALGTGEDRFLGGSAVDRVYGSDPDSADTERDDISTGGGPDYVHSGRSSVANDDVVRTGPDDNVVFMVPPSPTGVLDVRHGSTTVLFDLTAAVPTRWRLDIADRSIHRGTAIGTWAGDVSAWGFDADHGDATSTFALSGTDRSEQVFLWDGLDPFTTSVRLGRGADSLYAYGKPEERASYALGGDDDSLHVKPGTASSELRPGVYVRVDLAAGRLDFGSGTAAPATVISGVEDVTVAGTQVRVLGDGHSNAITVDGCDATVRAGAGDDHVRVVVLPYYGVAGCAHTSRVEGGPGSDELLGAHKSSDSLVGGPGRDFADGKGGADTCRAEVIRRCGTS